MKKPQLALRPAGAFLVNREEGRVKRVGVPHCGTDFRKGWRGRRRGCEREEGVRLAAWRSSGISGVRGCAVPAHFRARLRVLKESSPAGHERELLPAGAGVQKSTAENLPCFSVFFGLSQTQLIQQRERLPGKRRRRHRTRCRCQR